MNLVYIKYLKLYYLLSRKLNFNANKNDIYE